MQAIKTRITFSTLIGAVLMIVSSTVLAKPLTLENATKKPITIRINNICSSDFGTMIPNSSKTISDEILNKLCEKNISNCEATIFKSNDCNGDKIADFVFDTTSGLTDTFHSSKNYSMTISHPFNAVSLTEVL